MINGQWGWTRGSLDHRAIFQIGLERSAKEQKVGARSTDFFSIFPIFFPISQTVDFQRKRRALEAYWSAERWSKMCRSVGLPQQFFPVLPQQFLLVKESNVRVRAGEGNREPKCQNVTHKDLLYLPTPLVYGDWTFCCKEDQKRGMFSYKDVCVCLCGCVCVCVCVFLSLWDCVCVVC